MEQVKIVRSFCILSLFLCLHILQIFRLMTLFGCVLEVFTCFSVTKQYFSHTVHICNLSESSCPLKKPSLL